MIFWKKAKFLYWLDRVISVFKYLLAAFMMYAGVTTAISPTTPMGGSFGFIYSTRTSLVIFGIIFFVSGATLLYGKIRKKRKIIGKGLLAIYSCFLFATLLNLVALGDPGYWVNNLIATIIIGMVWLRWKFKTEYISAGEFSKDIAQIQHEDQHNESD